MIVTLENGKGKEHPTKVEVFLDKGVREMRQTERGNTRGGATKKREFSRTLLSINLHFSVHFKLGLKSKMPLESFSFLTMKRCSAAPNESDSQFHAGRQPQRRRRRRRRRRSRS